MCENRKLKFSLCTKVAPLMVLYCPYIILYICAIIFTFTHVRMPTYILLGQLKLTTGDVFLTVLKTHNLL